MTVEDFVNGLGATDVIPVADDGTWTCTCGEDGRGGAYWLYVHRRIMRCWNNNDTETS